MLNQINYINIYQFYTGLNEYQRNDYFHNFITIKHSKTSLHRPTIFVGNKIQI